MTLESTGRPGDGADDQGGGDDYSIEEIEDAVVDGDTPIGPNRARPVSALRHRTFRIVFLGFFASNIGTWMQNVVLGAYAYDLTHSSTFVGVVIFAQLGPTLVSPSRRPVRRQSQPQAASRPALVGAARLLAGRGPGRVVATPRVLLVLMVVFVGVGSAMFGPAYSAVLPGWSAAGPPGRSR